MKVNYYEILGVKRSASDGEIRNRFRQLARESHPDRYRGPDKAEAERKFQTLTEALNILTNPDKRQQYDTELAGGGGQGTVDFAQIAKAYMSHGVKAYKDGNWVGAYENFELATKHNPQDGKAFYYLAKAAEHIPSRSRQAVQAIETALQREPMNPLYLKDAGLLCKRAGLTAKAERYLEESLKWDASNLEVQTALAELRESREPGKGGFSIFGKR